ncbi:MAG: acylphosphatase [Lactovum sp.]
MQKVKITVTGRVQGVGFRYYCLKLAEELDIKGAVWNNEDGTVTILAQADSETLSLFQKKIRKGNQWVKVTYLNIETDNSENFNDFKIKN